MVCVSLRFGPEDRRDASLWNCRSDSCGCDPARVGAGDEAVDAWRQIKPVLRERLYACHGARSSLEPSCGSTRRRLAVKTKVSTLQHPVRAESQHALPDRRLAADERDLARRRHLDGIRSRARDSVAKTQLASLELAIESSETAGACDTGFACPYTNTISWKSQNTPLPTQHNPRVVFERLFGDSGSTDRRRLLRMRQQRSVLDSVTE